MTEFLTDQEKKWINEYHKNVYEKLSPHLSDDIAAWLKIQTAEI
ncbi:MAG: M24 family metallopeptidase C-terminal domain-containing protein [Bacillota bacterium]|nr:M24 family metallopeptidase C-terminal domain-containing protein [Bacillota bacterium]